MACMCAKNNTPICCESVPLWDLLLSRSVFFVAKFNSDLRMNVVYTSDKKVFCQ